jgi:hypothetical protein
LYFHFTVATILNSASCHPCVGVLQGLKQRFDLSKVPHLGSSSGACAAALSASGACLQQATVKGAKIFDEFGIANRCVNIDCIPVNELRLWHAFTG